MKAYSFYHINVIEEKGRTKRNVHFTKDLFIPEHYLARCSVRDVNVEPFILSSGKIFIDIEYPLYNEPLKDHYVRKYLYKGASLLISHFTIDRQLSWRQDFLSYVQSLKGLSIDYMIVPKIDIKYLTNDMVRFFGLQKVPFIIVELKEVKDINQIKWGWIRQMQMMVKIPLAVLENENAFALQSKLNQFDVITINQMVTKKPLKKEVLIQTGISPKKGEIRMYGDTDFNLYLKTDVFKKSNISLQSIMEGEANPYISVIRGNVIKLNQTIFDQKGFGQHHQISIQNHF